jgi:hypothetical protein
LTQYIIDTLHLLRSTLLHANKTAKDCIQFLNIPKYNIIMSKLRYFFLTGICADQFQLQQGLSWS